jgi:Na+-translocating ferredoxin:NAD+ oxidoreductase RnfD subunit
MPEKRQTERAGFRRLSPWVLRIPAAVVLAAVLALRAGQIDRFGSAVMYAASWIILLHVLIGEYVFIRCLHAVSRPHQLLDTFAGLLLLGGLLSFHRAALWCAFLAGAFALAITKYLLVEQHIENPALRLRPGEDDVGVAGRLPVFGSGGAD